MSVKLSQLKQEEIRGTVKVGRNKIKVFNPTNEVKKQIIEFIRQSQEDNSEIEADKLFSYLLSTLTNIEMDITEVVDVIASPSKHMVEVIGYLNDIIQDIIYEMLLEQKMSLSMVEKTMMGKEITEKVEKINSMIKEVEGNTNKILS